MQANIKIIPGIEPRKVTRELTEEEKNARKFRTGETFRFPLEIGTIFVFINKDEPKFYEGFTYDTFPCYQYSPNGDFKRIFYFPTNALDKYDYSEPKAESNRERRCINRNDYPFSNLNLAQLMIENGKCVKVCGTAKNRYQPTWNVDKYEFTGKETAQTAVRLEIVDIPEFALESAKAE
ncbi:hypothetical protein [Intestinibacter sp.]|uniref:hypothetical protein n=1 Tax=Intestinibacter sp. TaxID=1965304 RepID=UPI003F157E0B